MTDRDTEIRSLKGSIIQLEAQLVTARHSKQPPQRPDPVPATRLPLLQPQPTLASTSKHSRPQPPQVNQHPASGSSAGPASEVRQLGPFHHQPAPVVLCKPARALLPPEQGSMQLMEAVQKHVDPLASRPAPSVHMPLVQPRAQTVADMHDTVDQLELEMGSQELGQDMQPRSAASEQQPSRALTDAEQLTEAVPETPLKSQQPAGLGHASSAASPQPQHQPRRQDSAAPDKAAPAAEAAGRVSTGHQQQSDGSHNASGTCPSLSSMPSRDGQQHQQQQQRHAAAQPTDMLQQIFFSFALASGCSSGEDEGLHVELQPTGKSHQCPGRMYSCTIASALRYGERCSYEEIISRPSSPEGH